MKTYGPKQLDVRIEKEAGVVVAVVSGDAVTAANASVLRMKLAPLLAPRVQVVLDLAAVRFMDSSGIGAVVSLVRAVKEEGGDMKLCHVTPAVMNIFRLVHLDRMLDIFENREQALRALTPREDS